MNIVEKNWKWQSGLATRSSTKRIVMHNADAVNYSVDSCFAGHVANGWAGIGYHFYVTKDGTVYRGRPEDTVGAHAQGANSDSIGICAEGKYMVEQTMPSAQKEAIFELIDYLKGKYNSITELVGHREVGSTDCPGKYYPLDDFKQRFQNANTEVTSTSNDTVINDESSEIKKDLYNQYGVGVDSLAGKFTDSREGYHALVCNGINITDYACDLNWDSSMGSSTVSLTFSTPKSDTKYVKLYVPQVGDVVSLFTNAEIFRGIIVSTTETDTTVSCNCYDFGWYLTHNKETYQFNNQRASDIIEWICNDFQIPVESIPNLSYTVDQIYLDKTLAEIIDDVLSRDNVVYTYDVTPQGLRIYQPGSIYAYPEYRISQNTQLIQSMKTPSNLSVNYSIEDMKNSLKIVGEGDTAYNVEKVVQNPQSITMFGMLQEVISVDPKTTSIDIKSRNEFATLNAVKLEYTLDIIESVDSYTRAGSKIEFDGVEYLINSAKHSISNDIHSVSLTMTRWDESMLYKPESADIEQNSESESTETTTIVNNDNFDHSGNWITKWNATCYGWVGDDNGVCGWNSLRFRSQNSNTMLISGCHVAIPMYCIKAAGTYNYDKMMSDFPEFEGGYGTVVEIMNPENNKTVNAVVADCGNFGPGGYYNHDTALDLAPNTLEALGLPRSTNKIYYRVIGKVNSWNGEQL